MITKMKKVTFLIYHKEYEQFLQSIRDLGVVHVAEKAQGTAENTELQEKHPSVQPLCFNYQVPAITEC